VFTQSELTINIGLIGAPAVLSARIALWQQIKGIKINFFSCQPLPLLQSGIDYILLDSRDLLFQNSDVIDLLDESVQLTDHIEAITKAHKDFLWDNPFILDIEALRVATQLIRESGVKCQPGIYLRFQEDIQANSNFVFRYLETGVSFTPATPLNHNKWLALVNNHVDLLSFLAHAPIQRMAAFSLPINEREHALLNFRLQFDNKAVGSCTININALVEEQVSCLYNEKQQKLILWSQNNTISYDIFDQECVINALEAFISSSLGKKATKVSIFDALNSLELTKDIINQIEV
jgi:hypothetical protein